MNLDRFTSRVDGKKIRVITISATITVARSPWRTSP